MEIWGQKSRENGPKAEKDKTERATGLGRRQERRYRKVGSNWQPWDSRLGENTRNPPASLGGSGQYTGDWAKSRNKTTEWAAGLGRTTRWQIERWNQMTALRFQTGGGDIRRARPPFGPGRQKERTTITTKRAWRSQKPFLFMFSVHAMSMKNKIQDIDLQSLFPSHDNWCQYQYHVLIRADKEPPVPNLITLFPTFANPQSVNWRRSRFR